MKLIRKLWKWSPLVTVPVAILVIMWGWSTFTRWADFGLRHPNVDKMSLLRVGKMEGAHLKRKADVFFSGGGVQDRVKRSGLDPVQLFVSDASIGQLKSHLPDSGFQYKDGQLLYKGELRPVDVRYRGDTIYHWGYWKRSWRVKTDRNELFEGMRKFNLIAPRSPELLNNYLGHTLADVMGMISPTTSIVPLFLNGKFQGVYVLTEQLDESTIRRAGKMPGDVYSGDLARRDGFYGIGPKLFREPGTWTKVAINNHFDDDALDPLVRLLQLLRDAHSPEAQKELSELLDLEAFARFSAFEALSGTGHYDAHHNWRLYYDPWRTQFVPLVWDPVAWYGGWRHRPGTKLRADVLTSPLQKALFLNGDFLRLREKVFHEFFHEGKEAEFLKIVRDSLESVDPLLDIDGDMVFRAQVLEAGEVREALLTLESYIKTHFDKLKEHHIGSLGNRVDVAQLDAPGRFAVSVSGRRQAESLAWVFDRPPSASLGCTVRWLENGEWLEADMGHKLSLQGDKVELAAGMLSKRIIHANHTQYAKALQHHMECLPGYFEVELHGLPADSSLLMVESSFYGSGSVPCNLVEPMEPVDMAGIQQIVDLEPKRELLVWSGEVRVDGDLYVEDLIVEPGTRVLLGEAANVLVRGRMIARGTQESPIVFESSGEAPWGILGLKGPAANGSVLSHCVFRGGSGWMKPLAEYSAMVSIHDVQAVLFDHCTFDTSYVVDDMVHGVYSTIEFRDCHFIRARADALDMDISDVILSGCVFEESGNDALDLMTARAAVFDCQFLNSGDKGVSVGERSLLLMINTKIEGCFIGVQAKDDSSALIINSEFLANDTGFDAYKKNWRYDAGGSGKIVYSKLEGNSVSLRVDRNSDVSVYGSSVVGNTTSDGRGNVFLADDVYVGESAATSPIKAQRWKADELLREAGMTESLFMRFLDKVRVGRVGRAGPIRQ